MITQESVLQVRRQLHAAILETLVTEHNLTHPQVAALYGTSLKTVGNVAKVNNLHRVSGRKPRTV